MARRSYIDEPVSQWAAWSSRLAWFALAVAGLSVLILRSGLLEIGPSLATFGAALAFALVAILFALIAFISIWRQGVSGLGRALRGLFLGILLLAYPAYLAERGFSLPRIYDVSTDTANPPAFVALAAQRPRDRVVYPGAAVAQLQQKAYPDIVPLQVGLPARTAYEVALGVITKHKWQIASALPPAGNRRDGTIEATARTLLMGFRDDIVVRVTPNSQGARIDLRSASRFGAHDLGVNAARLHTLLEEIDEAASNAPEPRPEPKPPEPQKKPPAKRPPAAKPAPPVR